MTTATTVSSAQYHNVRHKEKKSDVEIRDNVLQNIVTTEVTDQERIDDLMNIMNIPPQKRKNFKVYNT